MAQANVVNTLVVPAQSRVAPFYDDFDESKNFQRIMFRPGYAVQARELTQIQTILQNQIERFGRHIFVNGSSVIGGKLDITEIVTLNVQPEFANSFINISEFKDKTIKLSSGNNDVIARVIQTSSATDTAPPALHIKYITGQEFSPGATISTNDGTSAILSTSSGFTSNGTLAFLYDSVYFMQGYFIKVPAQSVVVSKFNTNANARVGLELTEEFVDENSDTSLLDPAQESSNYQAPGAARYKVDLVLSTRSLDSQDDEKFIELAKVNNGVIEERTRTPLYSEIEEVLARRTYDESGNYVVKPYNLKIEESTLDPTNNFTLVVSAGKSYLYGFETESLVDTRIEIPRSRETEVKSNYNLNLNYGNYVVVANVSGNFNIQNQGIIDLHCVDKANVSYANSTTYNSTKVGTARISDLNFYSGDANVASRQFELYFYDNKFTTLTANAGGTSSATNQIVMNTVQTSAVTDAYTGAYLFIEAGPNLGERREIISYNGTTKVANVSPAFSTLCNANTRYTIRYDITDVDSFIQSSNFTGGATTNASATISTLNKDNGLLTGNTTVSEPSSSRMFFSYPERYIAPGITNESYVYRRTFPSVQFTSGESAVLTASTDEQFVGATSTSNVSSTVMDNFLVVVTNPLTSARALGEQVRVTTSISNSTPEQAVLNTSNTSESFIATVYSKMEAFGTSASPRVKSLVLANTQTFTSETASGPFVNSTGSTTFVYPNSGQVVIINPTKRNTEIESLFLSDVIAIPKIYAFSGNTSPAAGTDLSTLLDVTNRYTFNFGQRVSHYDHADIQLKPGFTSPSAIIVCCRLYKSSNDVGYFSVDSYPFLNSTIIEEGKNIGTGYSLIPTYSRIKLSDVIDFRPVRPNGSNNSNFTFTSSRAPVATTDFESSYSFYKRRRDIVAISPNKTPFLIQGQPANSPIFPKIPERSIILHRLSLNPYTETTKDIYIDSINHRRYTMSDISKLDQRLKAIEYSVRLNTLEKRAEDITIKDVDGLDRTKFGILADSYDSPLLGDVRLPDFQCSIDYTGKYSLSSTGGSLMPKMSTQYVDFDIKNERSHTYLVSKTDNKVLLSYSTEPAISQTTATKSTPVAEFLFGDFKGQLITTPSADIWRETRFLAPERVNIPVPQINVVPVADPPRVTATRPVRDPDVVLPRVTPVTTTLTRRAETCFTGNSLVTMSDGSKKRIDKVKVGETVLAFGNEIAKVVDIHTPIVGKRGLVSLNGSEPFATADHCFKSKDNVWLVADLEQAKISFPSYKDIIASGGLVREMQIGDILLNNKNEEIVIESFEIVGKDSEDDTTVYDLCLDRNHVYYVNDYAVHNCIPFTPTPTPEVSYTVTIIPITVTVDGVITQTVTETVTITVTETQTVTVSNDVISPTPPLYTPYVTTEVVTQVTTEIVTQTSPTEEVTFEPTVIPVTNDVVSPRSLLVALSTSDYYRGLGGLTYDQATGQYGTETGSRTALVDGNGVVQTARLTADQAARIAEAQIRETYNINLDLSEKDIERVSNLYTTVVGRPPEMAGIVYWASEAKINGWSKAEFVEKFYEGAYDSGMKTTPASVSQGVTDIVDGLFAYDQTSRTFSTTPAVDFTANPNIAAYSPTTASVATNNQTNNQVDTRSDVMDTRTQENRLEHVKGWYENIAGWSGHDSGYTYWSEKIEQMGEKEAFREFNTAVDKAIAEVNFNPINFEAEGASYMGEKIVGANEGILGQWANPEDIPSDN